MSYSQLPNRPSLYPVIDDTNPNSSSPYLSNPKPNFRSSSSSMYPTIDVSDFVGNYNHNSVPLSTAPPAEEVVPIEETLISIPGAVVHLIDQKYSVELAIGEFSIVRLRQGDNVIAFLARVSDELQWPLIKEESIVKVDDSHYFFSISDTSNVSDVLNYGLSFASKGQEGVLRELDKFFESLGNFEVKHVSKEVVGEAVAKEMTPEEIVVDSRKREVMERNCGAYWTTLAPNVEDYSSTTAKFIATGSGKMIQGILWCGDVTVDRMKWGHEVLRKRLDPAENKDIDKKTLKRIQRAKSMTKMTKKVANGVLLGVVKVSGFFMSSIGNSKVGKKFFSMLPGEILLASLDGYDKICDAVEVAGKEVLSTSSTVTTGLVTHKYGEKAGEAAQEGLGAAGHAIGTAWTVFKIRKALNPKNALKPSVFAKSAAKAAAAEHKSQKSKQ